MSSYQRAAATSFAKALLESSTHTEEYSVYKIDNKININIFGEFFELDNEKKLKKIADGRSLLDEIKRLNEEIEKLNEDNERLNEENTRLQCEIDDNKVEDEKKSNYLIY